MYKYICIQNYIFYIYNMYYIYLKQIINTFIYFYICTYFLYNIMNL